MNDQPSATTDASARGGIRPRMDVMPIVERVRSLILESEEELENRRIPEKLVDELYDAGVMRALMPEELGGLEMHPLDWLDLTYELSRLNGSVGWLAVICSGCTILFDMETMTELQAGTRLLNAGSAGRMGNALKVDGGYRVSGRWNFASGSPFADYLSATAFLVDQSDEPILDDAGRPQVLEVLFKADEVTRFENWDGLGLRGTGSNDFEAKDLFVDERMVHELGAWAEPFASRPLYRHFLAQQGHASHALGVARGAIDSYIELANRPAQRQSSRQLKVGKAQMDKVAVAKADALVRAARLFAWDTTNWIYEDAFDEARIDEAYLLLQEANIFAVRAGKEAVNLIFDRAGVDGVIRGRRLERQFRDMTTAAQHVANVEDAYEAIGHFHITGEPPHGPLVDVAIGPDGVLADMEPEKA